MLGKVRHRRQRDQRKREGFQITPTPLVSTPLISAHRFLFVVAFFLLIFTSTPLHTASALSCSHQAIPLDAKFNESSFVFTGIPKRAGGGAVPFTLTHVYKYPKGGVPQGAQVLVSFA